MSALARADEDRASRIPLGRQIDEVEGRLNRRRLDARNRAALLGIAVREKLASPVTIAGAVGLGFAVAWFYRRRPSDATHPEEKSSSTLATIMGALNFAGMMISLFPQATSFTESENDPR
ncbi:MAG: hypothetical protein ABIS68_10390 [Casimicrobiaceae bacterium]